MAYVQLRLVALELEGVSILSAREMLASGYATT